MAQKIGFIGLGRCGMPATQKYLENGFEVYSSARRPEVIKELESHGGKQMESPAKVAEAADLVFVMVLNDDQVIEVIDGPKGILRTMKSGGTIICMSTINRDNLEMLAAKVADQGINFIDCPFTGGPARIVNGTLTLIAAGPKDLVEKYRPIMEVIGKITYAGEKPGMAQAIKHCNQLLVTAVHAATMELIMLAREGGIDPALVCDVVGSGVAGNDYFRLVAKAVMENTTSPGGMGQLLKDVSIAVNSGKKLNLPLFTATSAMHYFMMAKAMGLENEDSARLIKVLEKMAGK